jgi:RHS repeat-associated protein
LQFFPTAEGYVKNTPVSGTNTYSYVFNYTDHLGNVRLSYTKNPSTNVLTILDESNYYPFGLKHSPYNAIAPMQEYKVKFQGQERQDELGLNWDSFKYRNYDYAIGRFHSIDPLCEKYNTWTPYAFSGNRVVDSRELEGLEPYVVTGRAFIPMKTVDSPIALISNTKSFKGDTRNNYDVNATSFRTEQKVKVDFDNNKVTTLNNTASPSVGYDKSGKAIETSKSEKAGPNPTYTTGTMKDGSTTVNMKVDASNKLVDGAPSINYDVNITLTQQKNGSLDYNISGATDGFPAYEFFITNQATGNSTLIYGSNPNKTGDSPTALFPPMEKTVSGKGNIPVKEEEKKK